MKISLVIATRNNLKYLKWSYDSIRKNQGNHEVWICYGIDHCTDGTQDWIEEIKKTDPLVKSIENKTGHRLGHTIMYDKIVYELVETDLAMIFHSDMYLCPEALDAIEELMFSSKKVINKNNPQYHPRKLDSGLVLEIVPIDNRIVSLTRIEPPLHPSGPEKIVQDFGTEPENFDEDKLLYTLDLLTPKSNDNTLINSKNDTNGVFAPWAFWVDEFKAIGGHDSLFAPQSKEDSDIFNRFKLNGCKFIQTWKGFVYHLTCRGSRFNPNLTQVGTNSSEWEEQNIRSSRNFIRKWGSFVTHDEYLHPIVPKKYNIGFVIKNCSYNLLYNLEPWCDSIQVDIEKEIIDRYIEFEQSKTKFDLKEKINNVKKLPNIIVEIDGRRYTQEDAINIQYLSEILTDQNELGDFELGNLKLNIKSLESYENNLVVCQNEPIELV